MLVIGQRGFVWFYTINSWSLWKLPNPIAVERHRHHFFQAVSSCLVAPHVSGHACPWEIWGPSTDPISVIGVSIFKNVGQRTQKSADPSRRVVAIILCKIQTVPKIQNPKSKIQNPKSKIQNPKSKIQDPKSKIQNPKSKIQNPKSKIQTPRSKIQTPKSKIQNPNGPFGFWILDFGVWIWVAGLGWLCSKRSCVGGLATQIWRSW